MRVTINLASRPFLELGPVYTRLRLFAALLVLLAIPLWLGARAESARAAAAQARLAVVHNNIQKLEQRRSTFEAAMREPQNADVLDRSKFLNQLFAQKAFSWTAVMMDLENVLPGGVQVLNIDPIIDRAGRVTIRLRVSGQHDRAVELVQNLEHSRRFLYPRLADEAAESNQLGRGLQSSQSPTSVNFDLLAEYNPLPVGAASAASGSKHASGGHEGGGHARGKVAARGRAKPAARRPYIPARRGAQR